jgi:hypothetical protein
MAQEGVRLVSVLNEAVWDRQRAGNSAAAAR